MKSVSNTTKVPAPENTLVQFAEGASLQDHPRTIRWIMAFTGKSKPTIYRWEEDGIFPKRMKLGPNSVAWSESEVRSWLAARIAGQSDEEIRQLVSDMSSRRRKPFICPEVPND